MGVPYLEYQSPDGQAARCPLADKPLTIGRHADNELTLADDRASRFHCVIEKIPTGYRVRDLQSRNGTKLNNQKIETAALKPGDVLRIGGTNFRFVDPDAPLALAADTDDSPDGYTPRIVAFGKAKGSAPAKSRAPAKAARPVQRTAARKSAPKAPRQKPEEVPPPPVEPDAQPEESDAGGVSDEAIRSLRELAASGDPDMTEGDIALINARGETVHAAGSGRSDEDDPQAQRETQEGARILRVLLLACLRARATDLHVEPKAGDYTVRVRVDGTMVELMHLDKRTAHRLVGVVKVLADIDIAQRAIIQEGHFSVQAPRRRIDYRVSFTPSMHGQKLVLRVLDLANAPRYLAELQMPEWMVQHIHRVSRQDAGMILVAGPTGSGKTTTLYTVLRDIDVAQRNVVTIEDPVEYQIQGVTQIPVDAQRGNDFATLLRSILRQDPDVILLGEVRDKETALTAMQAAMTGHLVLSTVHAKDTVGTVFRLLDLGVEPYLVASALNLVVAQRLVRVLCPHCKIEKKPTPQQQMRMGRAVEGLNKIYIPAGCPRCLGTGFAGRRGLYELLQISDDIRDVILKTPTISAIRQTLEMTVFTTLQQNGFRLVAEGVASMEEIERVTGTE